MGHPPHPILFGFTIDTKGRDKWRFMEKFEKYSVTPIFYDFNGRPKLPFPVTESVAIDSFSGILKPEHFSLWKNYVGTDDLKSISDG